MHSHLLSVLASLLNLASALTINHPRSNIPEQVPAEASLVDVLAFLYPEGPIYLREKREICLSLRNKRFRNAAPNIHPYTPRLVAAAAVANPILISMPSDEFISAFESRGAYISFAIDVLGI